MTKLGVLSKGITPCEQCGHPSTTMLEGEYLCEPCMKQLESKLAEENCIGRPFQKSMRRMLEELK
jgi:hypothetical protein